jgi:hypothetical protein
MLFYPLRHVRCGGADGCHSLGEGIECLMFMCPCMMMIIFFPLMLYGFIFGIPTIAVWCYCFIPYHGICLYFMFRVIAREIYYLLRKYILRNLTEEEITIEKELAEIKELMEPY